VTEVAVVVRENFRGPADSADFDADEVQIKPDIHSDPDVICGEISGICGHFFEP
jgi:hypothetical protein